MLMRACLSNYHDQGLNCTDEEDKAKRETGTLSFGAALSIVSFKIRQNAAAPIGSALPAFNQRKPRKHLVLYALTKRYVNLTDVNGPAGVI